MTPSEPDLPLTLKVFHESRLDEGKDDLPSLRLFMNIEECFERSRESQKLPPTDLRMRTNSQISTTGCAMTYAEYRANTCSNCSASCSV